MLPWPGGGAVDVAPWQSDGQEGASHWAPTLALQKTKGVIGIVWSPCVVMRCSNWHFEARLSFCIPGRTPRPFLEGWNLCYLPTVAHPHSLQFHEFSYLESCSLALDPSSQLWRQSWRGHLALCRAYPMFLGGLAQAASSVAFCGF